MLSIGAIVAIVYLRSRLRKEKKKVLVIGSVNNDLFVSLGKDETATFGKKEISLRSLKGKTLPSDAFLEELDVRDVKSPDEFLLSMEGTCVEATGGKGANTAAAAARSNRSELIAQFGTKSNNVNLFRDLRTYGNVRVDRCEMIESSTGTAYIFKYPDGDNCIGLIGGANQVKWNTDRPEFARAIREASVIMLQREIPTEANVSFAKIAQSENIPVLLDVGGTNEPVDRNLVPYISVVMPNESELTWISGVDCVVKDKISMKLLRNAVSTLRSKWNRKDDLEILVTLGKHGAIYFANDGQEYRVGSFRDVQVKDTTGAGDCFRGSFAAARYTMNFDILSALRWASAAASLCVEVSGAMPSMPSRTSIEHRLAHGKMAVLSFFDE